MADKFTEQLKKQAADAERASAEARELQRISETYASVLAAGYRRPWPVTYKVEAIPAGDRGATLQLVLDERIEQGWRVKTILDRDPLLVVFEQNQTVG